MINTSDHLNLSGGEVGYEGPIFNSPDFHHDIPHFNGKNLSSIQAQQTLLFKRTSSNQSNSSSLSRLN